VKVAILNTQVPFVQGGAELHAENLRHHLREFGHEAEIVAIPFKWYPPEKILDNMLACRLMDITESCGDKIDLAIGLRFPAYLIPHPNKVLWILHQHRSAYDLWPTNLCDLKHFANGKMVRDAIHTADRALIPEAKEVFTNSGNVTRRLKQYCDIDSRPLYHPPPNAEAFFTEKYEPYFFFPSRLNATKRQELVLEALAKTKNVVVYFSGTSSDPGYDKALEKKAAQLGINDRVRWLGHLSESDKRKHYANCLAVLFPPLDEDYGYITLEAMLSKKAVITMSDSGGPLEFITHKINGWVAPDCEGLAEAMASAWSNPKECQDMGQNGYESYIAKNITWQHVIESLTS
jgi:glycosyltransferase involved in cell wall biosynthesis